MNPTPPKKDLLRGLLLMGPVTEETFIHPESRSSIFTNPIVNFEAGEVT